MNSQFNDLNYDEQLGYEQDFPVALAERRSHERSAPLDEQTRLWVEGRAHVVDVIDLSPTGIGLLLPNIPFTIGPYVQVDHEQKQRTGVVAYLNRRDDGNYRLGVEWIELLRV